MLRMMAAEFGSTGRFEMSSFQGLSGRKDPHRAQNPSASGVSNITGVVERLVAGRSGRWSRMLGGNDGARQLHSGRLVRVAGLREADAVAGIGEDARHDRGDHLAHQGVQSETTGERQVLVVLQSAPEVGELDRRRSARARRGPRPGAACPRRDRSARRRRGCSPDRRSACSAGPGCRR